MPDEGGSAPPAASVLAAGRRRCRGRSSGPGPTRGAARDGVVLAAVRGEAAPTTVFSLCRAAFGDTQIDSVAIKVSYGFCTQWLFGPVHALQDRVKVKKTPHIYDRPRQIIYRVEIRTGDLPTKALRRSW